MVVVGATSSGGCSTMIAGRHIEIENSVGILLSEDHRGIRHSLLLVQLSPPPTHQLPSRHSSLQVDLKKMLPCAVL